jgi:hypothetical protein
MCLFSKVFTVIMHRIIHDKFIEYLGQGSLKLFEDILFIDLKE